MDWTDHLPPAKGSQQEKGKAVRLDEETHAKLTALAYEHNVTLSGAAKALINAAYEELER